MANYNTIKNQNQCRKIVFTRDKLDHLGYEITRQGIILSLPDKIQAMKYKAVPTKKKHLRSLIGSE